MSFNVTARREISSRAGETGKSPGEAGVILAARRRIISTGRSAAAASAYPASDASRTTSGPAMMSSR